MLFFLPYVEHKISFVIVALLASLMPDIDSTSSTLGHYKILRPLQYLVGHRGLIHSLLFCVAISVILAFYFPILALPFFLGYSTHLLADSFTLDGIKPFWPSKLEVRGRLRTGGRVEDGLFLGIMLVDFALLVGLFI